jgi:hypothetical protein
LIVFLFVHDSMLARYLKNSELEHPLVKLGGVENEKEEIEQMISGKVWLVRSGRNYVAESLKLEGTVGLLSWYLC